MCIYRSIGPIDCENDLCHLAWLIRDNRHLLPAVYLATCSNGTTFQQLDSNAYNSCPVTIKKKVIPIIRIIINLKHWHL